MHISLKPLLVLLTSAALVLCFASDASAGAGPSDKTIKKDLKKRVSGSKTIELRGVGKQMMDPKTLRQEWVRPATITSPTEYGKDIESVVRGEVIYIKKGKKWDYYKFVKLNEIYTGIASPSPEDAIAAVYENGWNLLIENYSSTTDLHAVKLAEDPQWAWKNPNYVSFILEVEASFAATSTRVDRVKYRMLMNLARANPKTTFLDHCKTMRAENRFCATSRTLETTPISSTTYTAKEVLDMPAIKDKGIY